MITSTKEIYQCEHCRKVYLRKGYAERHEIRCNKNPENFRQCFWCSHLIKKDHKVYLGMDDAGAEVYQDMKLFYCTALDQFMYTPDVEIKGNALELEVDNAPMPKECKLYL